jgi:hypothetical protein
MIARLKERGYIRADIVCRRDWALWSFVDVVDVGWTVQKGRLKLSPSQLVPDTTHQASCHTASMRIRVIRLCIDSIYTNCASLSATAKKKCLDR